MLTLPSETMLAEEVDVIDPQALHRARRALRKYLAQNLRADFLEAYQKNHTPGAYRPDPLSAGRRALRKASLSFSFKTPSTR